MINTTNLEEATWTLNSASLSLRTLQSIVWSWPPSQVYSAWPGGLKAPLDMICVVHSSHCSAIAPKSARWSRAYSRQCTRKNAQCQHLLASKQSMFSILPMQPHCHVAVIPPPLHHAPWSPCTVWPLQENYHNNPCRSRHQARHEIISGSIKLSSRRPVISSREACFAVVWEPASGFKFCLQNLFLRFCNDNLISTINKIIHFIAFVKRAYHMMMSKKMFKRAKLLLWLQIELDYIIADVGCWT